MKKNILQPKVKTDLISRVGEISPQATRKFGRMSVSQMLAHQNEALQVTYGEIRPAPRGNFFLKQFLRIFILNTDMPSPPEKAVTFTEIDQVLKKISPDFETEKKKLLKYIQNFPSQTLQERNPLLGKMSEKNWGRLMFTHIDHHLKQFNA